MLLFYLIFIFRVLQIPAFRVPGFTDSGFSCSRVLQIPVFRVLQILFQVLQIPAFRVPGFTNSGFSCSGFYRFRLFVFRVLQGFSCSGFYRFRVFSFLVPFLVPFPDSPFLVLHIAPDHIKILIKSLYTNFQTSIITFQFNTPFNHVGRGVLQGDCLSPLLFNLCFNTFVQHIKSDKYRQFGFSSTFLNPLRWFQFADDAAVITGQESENQHLLNRFAIWCQ